MMPTGELSLWLDERRARIDDALDRHVPPLGTRPAILHEAMRYALLAPGKRLRGTLLLASCEMLRGDERAALELACAVEMVHASSLILDDLPSMDNATMRRGRDVLHRKVGEADAILAAVALLNAGLATVTRVEGVNDRLRVALAGRLHEAIGAEGLIGGQVADLEATGQRVDLDMLEFIHSHKTGALFIAAAEMGAMLARGRARSIEALRRYAKNLGLAFQITDDLLDYSGTPAITGKDAGMDRHKTTFAVLCGIDGARGLVDELIDAAVIALDGFGRRAARLRDLAELVRGRDR